MTTKGLTKRQQVSERRASALSMRREGRPYAVIAASLDYSSAAAASKDVHRALQGAVMEQGRALLDLERDRLDHLTSILLPLAEKGDVRAARELIRIMERRARLLGLDRAATDRLATEGADVAKGVLSEFAVALQSAYAALPADTSTND